MRIIPALAAAVVLAACGPSAGPGASPTPAAASPDDAPDFKVRFETTRGSFVVGAYRSWAPLGADRFKELVEAKYFDGCRFFRVVPGFMAQFGINGDPAVTAKWQGAQIADDPVKMSNLRGYITFATAGPGTRTMQLFINFKDNVGLDGQGFSPFGRVLEGMDTVDALYSGYGDAPDPQRNPRGRGPSQARLQREGNTYLDREFGLLDSIKTARIVP